MGFWRMSGWKTHPPAAKCCHDFAGRKREDDDELLVVAADGVVIVSMKAKSDGLDVDHQSVRT